MDKLIPKKTTRRTFAFLCPKEKTTLVNVGRKTDERAY